MRIIAAIALAGVLASCTPAEILRLKRLLWPHDYPIEQAEPETPMPLPPDKPVVRHLEPESPADAPVPPVASPVVRPPPARHRGTPTASRRIQPRETKKKLDAGPDLPWPCVVVRLRACGKSTVEMRKLGRENNVKLSPKQERQARACLKTC